MQDVSHFGLQMALGFISLLITVLNSTHSATHREPEMQAANVAVDRSVE